MSKCSFSIPHSGNVEAILSGAKSGITGAGGTFTGDNTAGKFLLSTLIGNIAGEYTVNASTLDIEITDKPMFLGCSQIESELRKRINA